MESMNSWHKFLDDVRATRSENTYKNYRNALKHFKNGSLDEIKAFLSGNLADSTKKQTLKVLAIALEYNDAYDKARRKLIKSYRANVSVQECPTDENIELVWGNLLTHRDRAMFALMAYNGLRIGEVAGLDMDDLLKGNRLMLRNTKGKHDTIIPLVHSRVLSSLKAYIKERKSESPALFLNYRGARISSNGLTQLIRNEFHDNGLDFHAHSLRRYFANTLSRNGIPVQDIQVAMRHANIVTTMGYLNMDEDKTKSILQEVYHAV
ncbi:site-specific integrase [Mitsuokella jalaludinii]|uniref:tyrosine-type recombinase/integrase n=1 Tax=Mitsuokella jalaludinii TaxID=187979 RepID=UPI0030799A33